MTVASVRAREQITEIVGGQIVAVTDAPARKFSEFEARRLKDFIHANVDRALSQVRSCRDSQSRLKAIFAVIFKTLLERHRTGTFLTNALPRQKS